jgi:regulator of cell morphogenesis and NO signaling
MKIQAESYIGEIAAKLPQAIPLFQSKGIDYCCGGNQPLWKACASAGIASGDLVLELERLLAGSGGEGEERWDGLFQLIDHILKKHHAYTKSQLDLTEGLSAKVLRVHGEGHPELRQVDGLVRKMAGELRHHMAKEEQVAFPYLIRMEDSIKSGMEDRGLFPFEVFKSQPQRCLMQDHEETGEQLEELRSLTSGYRPPSNACVSYRAFYKALEELEADIHRHVHLENNVLFPMAERLAAGPGRADKIGPRNG